MDDGTRWWCDLDGCPVEVDAEPDEDDEDWPPVPPPGWLSVVVTRHRAQDVVLVLCSQEHLVEAMRTLPAAMELPPPPQQSWWEKPVFGLAALVLVAVVLLGIGSLAVVLWDVGGWVLGLL